MTPNYIDFVRFLVAIPCCNVKLCYQKMECETKKCELLPEYSKSYIKNK